MAHMLRKYTSNRGSALFMVISTMTALFISCMAMYFSMASARSSQYMVYNQTQANQTAMSITRLVVGELTYFQLDTTGHPTFSDLYYLVDDLEENESITTDANGFKSLDPGDDSLGADDPNLGAFSVTITCEGVNADGTKIIDVMVLATVDGSRDALHTKIPNFGAINLNNPDPTGGGDSELFAATGYMPNDAYIDGGYYLTDVFYDTQYTYMNTFDPGSGENRIGYSIRTGGDLLLGANAQSVVHAFSSDAISSDDVDHITPVTWAIRGNFYPTISSDMALRGGSEILVGGNFYHTGEPFFQTKNTSYVSKDTYLYVYVNGDFDYGSNKLKGNLRIFVNGNFIYGGSGADANTEVYVTGNVAAKQAYSPGLTLKAWDDSAPGMTYDEFLEKLGRETATVAYYKWDLSSEFTSAQNIDIMINASDNVYEDGSVSIPANQNVFIIAYDEDSANGQLVKSGKEAGVIGNSFIIDNVYTHEDTNKNRSQTIIIDTGDDPDNVITIQATDVTGNGEFSWFVDRQETVISWWPYQAVFGDPHTISDTIDGHRKRSVLVYGRGTVVVDVPSGITYQDATSQFTGHVGWFLIENAIAGGVGVTERNGHLDFEGIDPQGHYSHEVIKYIHKVCDEDSCSLDDSTTSAVKCVECGDYLSQVTCTEHGDVGKYCSACHPEKADKNWCKSHFEKSKFDALYPTLSAANKAAVTGKDGDIVYPTTNFMLVSCEEGSDMRFTIMKDDTPIKYNSFFGFIYAPYVSYRANATYNLGGAIGLIGGMTVSDYDMKAIQSYTGCYPDKMPMDMAGLGIGSAGGPLQGASKSWKVEVGGYY